MTHDPRTAPCLKDSLNHAREVLADLLLADEMADIINPDNRSDYEKADAILTALATAGLRVVAAEPSEADVERVANAIALEYFHKDVVEWDPVARAAIRAFLRGDDA